MALYSQEIERCNSELKRKANEMSMSEERYRQIVRENEEFRARISMTENRFGQDARSLE